MDPLKGLDFSYHKVLEEGAWDFHTGLGLTETSVVAHIGRSSFAHYQETFLTAF
jgi:hypothetical protein